MGLQVLERGFDRRQRGQIALLAPSQQGEVASRGPAKYLSGLLPSAPMTVRSRPAWLFTIARAARSCRMPSAMAANTCPASRMTVRVSRPPNRRARRPAPSRKAATRRLGVGHGWRAGRVGAGSAGLAPTGGRPKLSSCGCAMVAARRAPILERGERGRGRARPLVEEVAEGIPIVGQGRRAGPEGPRPCRKPRGCRGWSRGSLRRTAPAERAGLSAAARAGSAASRARRSARCPRCRRSPGPREAGAWGGRRRPFSRVPFVLPRSVILKPSSSASIRQWRRERVGVAPPSSMTQSLPSPRPILRRPRSRRRRSPVSSTSMTSIAPIARLRRTRR